jgi:hypothetical protein
MVVFMWENKKEGIWNLVITAILVEASGAVVGREGL